MVKAVGADDGRGFSLLAWDVSADQEEPLRRLYQELSGPRSKEYAELRRRLSIAAESAWFAPRPSGGGVAVVCLEAENPERALRRLSAELAAQGTSFTSWYGLRMSELFGCDLARSLRVPVAELLFRTREVLHQETQGPSEHSWPGVTFGRKEAAKRGEAGPDGGDVA